MNLSRLCEDARNLLMDWRTAQDEHGWAIEVIRDILGPILEDDEEAQEEISEIMATEGITEDYEDEEDEE